MIDFLRPASLLIALLLSPALPAWGQAGHRATALIAEAHLTPAAQQAVESFLREFEPPGANLATIATWADEIKGDDEADVTFRWHYINLPDSAETYDAARDCPDGNCVVEMINHCVRVLRNPSASRESQHTALKFLVHFVGDVHQPLHAARASDRGGNAILVRSGNRDTNLHSVWDVDLVHEVRPIAQEIASSILASLTPELADQWSTGQVEEWVMESHAFALSQAYPIPPGGIITTEYVDANLPVVRTQIARGGLRLAALLNESLRGAPGEAQDFQWMREMTRPVSVTPEPASP